MKPDAAAGKRAEIVTAFKVRCFTSPFSSADGFLSSTRGMLMVWFLSHVLVCY